MVSSCQPDQHGSGGHEQDGEQAGRGERFLQDDDAEEHAEDDGGFAQGRHQGDGGFGHGPDGDAVGAHVAQAAEGGDAQAGAGIGQEGSAVAQEDKGHEGEGFDKEDPAGVADGVAADARAIAVGERVAHDDDGGAEDDGQIGRSGPFAVQAVPGQGQHAAAQQQHAAPAAGGEGRAEQQHGHGGEHGGAAAHDGVAEGEVHAGVGGRDTDVIGKVNDA